MATDPTRRIRRRRVVSPFSLGAEDFVERLGHLEPSIDTPYLTVTVDWRPEGTSPGRAEPEEVKRSQRRSGQEAEGDRWRPAIEVLEQQIEDLIEEHGPRGAAHESLQADYQRIQDYLQTELDPSARGACFVANSGKGVFEATGFSMPLPNEVSAGPVPSMSSLVRLVEDNPVFGVLLADQQDATLTFFSAGTVSRRVTLEGTDFPRHQQQGGWSQRRYQMRARERIEAFAGDVAEETRKALERFDVDMLVLAGNEVMTSTLHNTFHQTVQDRIVATVAMDLTAGESEMLEAALPIVLDVERQREADNVRRVQDAIGMGARGVSGQAETLQPLQNGQVDTLVILDTFEGTGWADYTLPVFGTGDVPTTHPYGGDVSSIRRIDLRQEMVRLALATDAEVDIIHSDVPVAEDEAPRDEGEERPITDAARALQEMGGVGALLRYELDETAGDQAI
jgi:peptide subunit release factor 1 (eRF1)